MVSSGVPFGSSLVVPRAASPAVSFTIIHREAWLAFLIQQGYELESEAVFDIRSRQPNTITCL